VVHNWKDISSHSSNTASSKLRRMGLGRRGGGALFVEKFKGDVEKMCINGRPGHRGCSLVNNRYDQQKKSAD
jgi:hypothetical protein